MATPRDRLNTKPKNPSREAGIVRLPAPIVRVAAPQVKVNLAAPDMKQIARAVDTLASAHGQFMDLIGHLENEQHKIMREISNTISSQTEILRQLAAKSGDIKVAAPIVKMAPRPDSFYVELEKDRGETVGMRIRAESPN